MDLRVFYKQMRELEASIETAYVVIASRETPDGGKADVLTEAPRALAAKLVVQGKARLATAEEAAAFHAKAEEQRKLAAQEPAAGRVQLAVLPEEAWNAIRETVRTRERSK